MVFAGDIEEKNVSHQSLTQNYQFIALLEQPEATVLLELQ